MGVHISQLPQHVKDRLGLKDPQHKQFWAVIGSKEPIYFRSSWEYYYAIFLEKLRQERKIIDWRHEPNASGSKVSSVVYARICLIFASCTLITQRNGQKLRGTTIQSPKQR
jgi:hypothetical protein